MEVGGEREAGIIESFKEKVAELGSKVEKERRGTKN